MAQNKRDSIDSKYIQQHLANERTYLAWVRTSITIIGVGFLITNLHFSTMALKVPIGDVLAKFIGLASIILGLSMLIMTTIGYFKKGRDINNQTFIFAKVLVIFLSFALSLIFLVFGLYYLYVWNQI